MPVPVMVTCAVDVVSVPPVTYCTLIVQLPPGAITEVAVQVPPAMIEKVPFAPVALVIVGAAVMVRGAVAAAELLTVTKPVLGAVVAGVVVSVG